MLLPLRVSFRSATCQLSYSSVAMLTDSAEPSSSRMKPCCLPNWAGTGSSHVLTKRGHHLPVDSLAHGLLLDSGGLLGRRGTACASCEHKGGCGQGKKHRSSQHGFPPVVTGMRSPPLRHAAPHEEPHAFILPRLDGPRPAKPHGETFAMPQASIFGITLSPSPSP